MWDGERSLQALDHVADEDFPQRYDSLIALHMKELSRWEKRSNMPLLRGIRIIADVIQDEKHGGI